MSFAENIKRIRAVWDMTQAELGSLIGIGQSSIGNYEKGTEPTLSNALTLARLTGISVENLVNRKLEFDEIPLQPIKESMALQEPEPTTPAYQRLPASNTDLGDLADYRKLVQTVRSHDEILNRVKTMAGSLGDGEKSQLNLLQAMLTVIQFLEASMDESDYAEDKAQFLEKLSKVLGGKK